MFKVCINYQGPVGVELDSDTDKTERSALGHAPLLGNKVLNLIQLASVCQNVFVLLVHVLLQLPLKIPVPS